MGKNNRSVFRDIFILNSRNEYETEIAKMCFDIVGVLVVAVDLDGNVTLINKKGCSILEYDEDEIIGKNWLSSFVDETKRDEAGMNFKNASGVATDHKEVFPYVLISKSGKKRIIEARKVVMRNEKDEIIGFLISGEDVTDFHTFQNTLKKLVYQYRTLAGNIPNTDMYLFDKSLRFLIAEGTDMKKYNHTKDDFEGKTVYEVLDNEAKRFLIPLYESAITGKEISTEFSSNGNDYIISLLPLRNNEGEIYGGMSIIQNITKEKNITQNLRKAKDIAEDANSAKNSFLASVSHEIRTPLNAIIGFSEQLSKTHMSKQQQNFVDIIAKSSDHLLSLVNEILVLSKIDAGEVYFNEQPFKPVQVVKEVYNTLKIKAGEKSINFKYNDENCGERILLGDTLRLKQILINIANNAIKFTESGYVDIKCQVQEENEDTVKVQFDITDTGIGIPDEKLEAIFEEFKQADSTVLKKYGGTGLGLTISKHLVELQGGTISVKSELGGGSCFTIVIPYKTTSDKNIEIQEGELIDTSLLADMKILLVDDDNVNRLLGKTILDNFKCEVDLAEGGQEAIEKIKNKKYDIILLDIHMPDVSGIDVANYIRKDLNDQETTIIAVTAAVMKQDIIQYFGVGINDYLVKPFKELNMFNKIHRSLESNNRTIRFYEEEDVEEKLKTAAPLFNLNELKRIAKNDSGFMQKILNTFIDNSKQGVQDMQTFVKEKNWKQIGETAHRLLPSYRHLEVKSVISDLVEIKSKTIINPSYREVPKLVKKVSTEISFLISELKKELRNM